MTTQPIPSPVWVEIVVPRRLWDLVHSRAMVGAAIYREGRYARMKHSGKSPEEAMLDGLGAEAAVAEAIGGHWNEGHRERNGIWLPDIEPDIEVKDTFPGGWLKVQPKDAKNREAPIVHTVGNFPTYLCGGWIPTAACLRDEWKHEQDEWVTFEGRTFQTIECWYADPAILWPLATLKP